jgi:hypothetical protein
LHHRDKFTLPHQKGFIRAFPLPKYGLRKRFYSSNEGLLRLKEGGKQLSRGGAGNPIEGSCFSERLPVISRYKIMVSVSERCPGWTFQIFFLLLTKKGKGPAK